MKIRRTTRNRGVLRRFAFALLFAASLPAQDAPPSGGVNGRVVAGREEQPVAGAYVRARSRSSPNAEGVFSGADGTFRLSGIAPGEYYLYAEKTSFDAEGLRITVESEQKVSELTLHMIPRSVIAGTVRDADGNPVVGARVRTYRPGDGMRGGRGRRYFRQAVSDDRGAYRLWPLTEGRYLIAVEARSEMVGPGRARLAHGPAFYPDATNPAEAQAVELLVGQQLEGVDVVVPSPARSVVLGAATTESDADREPCEHCRFNVYQSAGDDVFLIAQSQAGPEGGFQVEGLLEGEYSFSFSDRDRTTEVDVWAEASIALARDSRAELVAVLRPAVPLTVRTMLVNPPDELAGGDDPQAARFVSLIPAGSGARRGEEQLRPSSPDDERAFGIDRIVPGRYRVADVRFPGGRFAGLRTNGREVVPPVIEVLASGKQRDHEILIAFNSALIRGEIELDQSRRGTILSVAAWPLGDAPSLDSAQTYPAAGVPFELSPLAPGRYEVFAGSPRAMSRLSDPRVRAKAASHGVRVEVKANETATVKLQALSFYDLSR